MKTFFELREKTLTKAELKKREEVAKAIERENPNMPMDKKMAIATATAKKVAEATLRLDVNKASDDELKQYVKKSSTTIARSPSVHPDVMHTHDAAQKELKKRQKMQEEAEQIDEISRDLARRYIRKVADKTNTGELNTKQVMKRRPGVNLAGKKAYPGVAGEPKVRATESVEQIDEISDKKLDAYRQKAFADQPSGDDGSDKYRKRKFGRDLAFAKQTGRAKVRATESVTLDELSKKTLGTYVKKATGSAVGLGAITTAQAMSSKGKADPDDKRQLRNRMTGVSRATDRLTKEEVELDEVSKSTLGRYVKAASTDAARKTSEKDSVDTNYPKHSFQDRLGYKKELGKKINQRRVGISKAVDRLTKEETELDEVSSSTLLRYSVKSAMQGGGDKGDKRIAGQKMADEKLRKKHGNSSTAKVAAGAARRESVELEEGISNLSHSRLKFHATKGVPHGSYSNKEIKDEHNRRMRTEPDYVKAKASLGE